jgi:hypothetical protein
VDPLEPGQVVEGLLGSENDISHDEFVDQSTSKLSLQSFEVSNSDSLTSMSGFLQSQPDSPASYTQSAPSRTREHRAMKEPKSIRK